MKEYKKGDKKKKERKGKEKKKAKKKEQRQNKTKKPYLRYIKQKENKKLVTKFKALAF